MRIIAGSRKGARIFAPKGAETRPTGDRVRGAGEQLETAYQVYVWIPPAQQRHGRTPFRYPGGLPTTGVGKRLAGYFTGRACQSCRPMAEMGPPCVCPPVELR